MNIDIAAMTVSIISIFTALFALKISLQRYELQKEQFDLQKKEFDEKLKVRLEIKDEYLLTSHQLEPENSEHYREHPEDFKFEYHAKYINRSNVMIQIQRLTIAVDAIDIDEMWLGCGDTVHQNTFIAPHEELDVVHRFNQGNLKGFRRAIANFSDKTGTLEFSVNCKFGNSDGGVTKEHSRILYRMTENCGDMSTRGYDAGKSKEKRHFLY